MSIFDYFNPPEEDYGPTPDELANFWQVQDRYAAGPPGAPPMGGPPPGLLPEPGSTFADRFATGIAQMPQQRMRGFLPNLVQGAARGFAGGNLQGQQLRAQANDRTRQAAAEQNRERIAATEKLRERQLRASLAGQALRAHGIEAQRERMAKLLEQQQANDPAYQAQQGRLAGIRLAAQNSVPGARADKPDFGPLDTPLPTGYTPRQLTQLGVLNDNVKGDPDIKDFVTVRDNYERIRGSVNSQSGLGDLAMIFAYMKVLDPTSVVRETEFKNAGEAVGKLPILANTPARWLKGSRLTPEGRAGFLAEATKLYKLKEAQYRRAVEQHTRAAKAYGIDPNLVLRDYTAPSDSSAAVVRWTRDANGKLVRQ